jgi:hypothetical protein
VQVSRSLIFKWHKRFPDGRDSLADDEREGRPSFRESDAVKNEDRDVINGDRRLTVREVADKCTARCSTFSANVPFFSNADPVFSASNPDFSAISKL